MQSRIKETHKGHKFIKIDHDEMIDKLSGLGICDSCSLDIEEDGYLLPVLNSVYCEKCFLDFKNNADKMYDEDKTYEKEKLNEFINIQVKKACNLCHFVDVPEGLTSLICTLTGKPVEDEHVCEIFKVCDAVFDDTFFRIEKVEVDGN